ncbi:hypothetical protein [Anaeromassilibacillus senegalensis]|mgnify:CR=1 FL=1|uniref:hypothetical protein n=1 Tax=Anaeromassilibacillus senegalensis TaxID=1673717 RepID=UPI00067FD8A1|nr:hypothetical protein [Anaeromassilibacillus senegalensis]
MPNNQTHNAPLQDNEKMQKFFSCQPYFVQESIMQTGVGASSETELHQCAENLTKKNYNQE